MYLNEKKLPKYFPIVVILVGLALIAGGIAMGDFKEIMQLGSKICLSCMGLDG